MDKNRTNIFAIALVVSAAFGSAWIGPAARAQAVVFDPTNYIENFMTQLRAVQSNINEAQQLSNQLKQYQNMLKNTDSLSGGMWEQANGAFGRLSGVLEQGQSIAVSARDYESVFKARFPGYASQSNYGDSYRKWNQTSRDSILGALRVANLQVQGIRDESQALAVLRLAASTSGGQKAAIDAGNQIALAQVNQLQQLRELMVAQMQAQGTYMAAQDQAKAAGAASITGATKYRDPRDGWEPKPIEFNK